MYDIKYDCSDTISDVLLFVVLGHDGVELLEVKALLVSLWFMNIECTPAPATLTQLANPIQINTVAHSARSSSKIESSFIISPESFASCFTCS